MKLQALAALFAAVGAANAHGLNPRHAHIHKRQDATTSTSSTGAPAATQTTSSSSTDSTSTSGSAAAAGTSTGTVASVPTATGSYATMSATVADVPALSALTFGMPSGPTYTATTTVAAGYTPSISGLPDAPAIPGFVFKTGEWPAQDRAPPTDSDEVKEWLKELEGFDIPNLEPTTDGSCASDLQFAQDAANRGWWTCGGYTRDTDIVACPDKLTWGVSFDDGPGPTKLTFFPSSKLLDYLDKKDISATFFVVGSRVIEQYLSGHEISVHTWSHTHLTQQTNEQIVAELGWTRKAIKEVLGVTPTTMRPHTVTLVCLCATMMRVHLFDHLDDRVRAIALAMGLVPVIWTRTPAGTFDTNDWAVAAGNVNGEQCVEKFDSILGNATTLDTGFIVLAHDLYEITVDLAIGYNLEMAQTHNPAFTLMAIGQCLNIPTTDLYRETNTNTSFPYATKVSVSGNGTVDSVTAADTKGSGTTSGAMSLQSSSLFSLVAVAAVFSLML
ncbi:glycoside hydrolase/deacetylase [Hymenopellis radicata]|nr:glycoside hydrolase/deacetylase [Hymenopellis radicata]